MWGITLLFIRFCVAAKEVAFFVRGFGCALFIFGVEYYEI